MVDEEAEGDDEEMKEEDGRRTDPESLKFL